MLPPPAEKLQNFFGVFLQFQIGVDIKMPRGDKGYIIQYPLLIPLHISEQEAIAGMIAAMDEEIQNLKVERDKMIQIREGAMDDLLTGQVRLGA